MAKQDTINVASYLGIESTEGTPVTPDTQFLSLAFNLGIEAEYQEFGAQGFQHQTGVQRLKEWTSVELPEKPICFNSLTFPLSIGIKAVGAPTADGTNGKKRVFTASDTIKTATIVEGDSVEADQAAGVFLHTYNFMMGRSKGGFSASGMARLLSLNGGSIPGGPTLISQVILDPSKWAVRLADTKAGLDGASDESGIYEGSVVIPTRWGTHWPMNPANTSFAGRVKLPSAVSASIQIINDATGRGLITTNMRGNTGKYVRFSNTGPVIAGGVASAYLLQIDFFGQIVGGPKYNDFEGLRTLPLEFRGLKASDLDAYEITLINTIATTI